MGASLTTVDSITKEVYGPRIVDQTENETQLLKRIEKTGRGVTSHAGGKYVTFPLRVGRNAGIGYRNSGEQLQNPGQQRYADVRVPLRYGYGRVYIDGPVFELVEENYQAFSSAMTREMDGLKDDLVKDTNRILYGDGVGVLATVDTGAAGVNTISLGTDADALKWVEQGFQVDVVSADGTTVKASNRQVTAVNEATGDITLDGAAFTVVVGDVVTRTGNYGKEPQGLSSIVESSGELFNLDPAVEPKWASYVDSTGGALTEPNMIKTCDEVRRRGGKVSLIATDLGSRRAYHALLTQQRRYTNTKDFDGGVSGLEFNYGAAVVPVMEDVDAPAGTMFFLDESTFTVYRNKPWYWEDKDGSVWKWVDDFDAFQALMKQYWEFGNERRNANAKMTGITPA